MAGIRGFRGVVLVLLLAGTPVGGCAQSGEERTPRAIEAAYEERLRTMLDTAFAQIEAQADTIDEALKPLPLLTGAEERAMRKYLNAAHLERARRLGVDRPEDSAAVEELVRARGLVPLVDSSAYWIVRELDYSSPHVTPDMRELLAEIGRRFHVELAEVGLPPLRFEVTSALRTADTQAALRQRNVNAASGESTHEFGTTVDIAYNSFAVPRLRDAGIDTRTAPWLTPYLYRYADAMLQTVLAQRSRELQTILGQVLIELQDEGKVYITMERRQPVFHITVASRF